jgi:hypothetical protein
MPGNWIVEVYPGTMGRHSKGDYVVKIGGFVSIPRDRLQATGYRTLGDAADHGEVGITAMWGGDGFRGRVIGRPNT